MDHLLGKSRWKSVLRRRLQPQAEWEAFWIWDPEDGEIETVNSVGQLPKLTMPVSDFAGSEIVPNIRVNPCLESGIQEEKRLQWWAETIASDNRPFRPTISSNEWPQQLPDYRESFDVVLIFQGVKFIVALKIWANECRIFVVCFSSFLSGISARKLHHVNRNLQWETR
jgi:hypothetical protein